MKLIAIGDIHGCYRTLKELLTKVVQRLSPNEPIQIVFLGDYVDRGPRSKQVLDLMINFADQGLNYVFLRGNHEDMLSAFCDDPYNMQKSKMYLYNGGYETLKSLADQADPERITLPDKKYSDFVRAMPLYHKVGKWVFVHAGIDPTIPLEKQSEIDLLWSRGFIDVTEFPNDMRVVHGHTPYTNLDFRQCGNQFNLDSGCVFGHWLTAMIIDTETDEFEFIEQPYCD